MRGRGQDPCTNEQRLALALRGVWAHAVHKEPVQDVWSGGWCAQVRGMGGELDRGR